MYQQLLRSVSMTTQIMRKLWSSSTAPRLMHYLCRRPQSPSDCRTNNAAGNVYYNEKCTSAVVGQRSFGGARTSRTNDKAGSISVFHRLSARSRKENLAGLGDFQYPSNLI
ncbi:hypothetical protein BDR07DRAFT_364411 [Suillus spraguei]|nr:hypothetical protein BDR07DRAFT_364411 [Suillus spraguei]